MYYYLKTVDNRVARQQFISIPSAAQGRSGEATLKIQRQESNECQGVQEEREWGTSPLLSRRVSINVSGMIFETSYATLQRYPDSLLANSKINSKYFDKVRGQFYFDRNRTAFECIFFFYQSGGKLLKPQDITSEEFLEELKFFQVGEEVIQKYAQTYCPHLLPNEHKEDEDMPKNHLQKKIWLLFDAPESSQGARVVAGLSVLMIMMSVVVLCAQSMHNQPTRALSIKDKWGHTPLTDPYNLHLKIVPEEEQFFTTQQPVFNASQGHEIWGASASLVPPINTTIDPLELEQKAREKEERSRQQRLVNDVLNSLEGMAMGWFAIEYFVRLLSCPNKKRFLKNMLNFFDVIAVLPFLVCLAFKVFHLNVDHSKAKPLMILRITRLVRVFPILKLTRHSKNLQILAKTFRSSLNELGLLIFFFSISVVLFSSAIYLAENEENKPNFISIPNSFWYSIVTMTTVGYGDMCPVTPMGKVIGSMCALVGILTLSLPVPIIVSNFSYHYSMQGPLVEGEASTIGDTLQRYSMMSPHIRRGK